MEDEVELEPDGESEDNRVVHQLSAVSGTSRVSLNDLRFELFRRSKENTDDSHIILAEEPNPCLMAERMRTYHPTSQVSNANAQAKGRWRGGFVRRQVDQRNGIFATPADYQS